MLKGAKRTSWRFLRKFRVPDVLESYPEIVSQYLSFGATVADIGGGRRCLFDHKGCRLIAVDISADELSHNRDADERIEADATRCIPLPPCSVDVLTSQSVVEHMKGVEKYVQNAHKVLKPGGIFITAFPNKRALSSLLNRIIPHTIKRRLITSLKPENVNYLGFRAYYEHCSRKAFESVLRRNDFEILSVHTGFFQADYFDSIPPLCALVCAYDRLLWWLDVDSFCATLVIVARRERESTERVAQEDILEDCAALV